MATATTAATVQDFGGLDLYRVQMGGLVAQGTAAKGARPRSWTVTLGRVALANVDAGAVRTAFPLRGRAMAKLLRAIEGGR